MTSGENEASRSSAKIGQLQCANRLQAAMRSASKMAETIELSSSESDSDLVVDGATIKPRPKLRTRRSPLEESPEVARPPKRVREASKKAALQFSDEDEEDEEEEEDNDETENYVDQVETPSSDEQLPEEDTRRRSGRARKQVQSVIDLSDDDFMDSSSEELEEAPKPKKKKTAKSKPKSKPKKKKRKRSSSNSSDDDADYGSEVEFVGNAGANGVNPDSDGFIIDKVLAREVHTMKEWKKMCANKNTRFLTHCSIFMPDEEEEEQKEERKASTGEQKQDGDSNTSEKQQVGDAGTTDKQQDESISIDEQKQQRIDTSAVANDALTVASAIDVEEEDAGEERFLIKWKKLSYLHTSWQTENELLETDKNAKGKIQRFREKELRDIYSQNVHGDEYYSPEFRIVDRILEIRDRPLDDFSPDYVEEDSDKKLQYFLVKWKALPYDDITWEREDDVGDDAAVEQYNNRIIRAAKRFKKVALAKHTPQTNKRKLNFRGYTAESPPPCKKEQSFQLRDYQLTGVNWMLFNWYQKRNSMLADEMGLGKTVQTVMYINHLAVVERVPQPFIIVAPLSTLGHWQREFDSWTNLNAVVYHGSAAAREVLQNYEFFLSEDELLRAEKLSGKVANTNGKKSSPRPKRNCYRFDVLITTYEMASATDLYKLAQIDWQLMVVDEAHRLKNRNSKLSNILHTRFRFENMLLLTGTPLQNNVEELWVLLNFLDQKKFQSKEDFLESFGELTDSTQVERLHSELKPYLLRRMKEDVEKSLAPKEETIIEVELTVLQKQYYRAIYEKNTEFLARGGRKGDTPSLMNVLMELRKCCNHPFLVKGVEEREIRRISQQKSETKEDIQRQISESLVNSSGKLVLLDKLLPRLKETNHRVLIFSQFKIMLDIVQDYLALRRYNCERIDGNITGNERQSAIDRFCRKDSNAFIMLLSTRAGGVGINLTAADTVIIYDSDWNPQNDLQAQARCHRIGQKKSVKIYRLLTSKTYELQMFHKASLKLGLDQAVLGGMQSDDPVAKLKGQKKQSNPNARMSKEEIENLLKHGAYEIFKEQESEAEAASRKFGEESIDQILSRSTTIVHDPTQNPDGSAKKNAMSSFSKATFVSSANPDEEVDVDDPNFWTKVIGLKGVEEQKKEEPSPLKKRRCRRNVKSYLLDDSGDEFGTSSRKKPSFGKVTKDEEFVISDDDDDDDDDDSDAALAPDDFLGIGGAKKRKRSKVPVAPIYAHTERIVELLTSFGYGRWDDMVRHSPSLQVYSAKEMRKFVQDYILNLLRVSTALSVFSRIGLDLEPSQVYIVSNVPPPVHGQDAGPLDRYGHELKSASRRYKFFDAMTKDMGSPNLLGVAVPPRMWVTDLSARSARLFRPKLQQIDTVYKLTQFVRQKFIPTAPLIDLIKDLQKVGDEAAVQEMIDLGTLPPAADDASEVKVVSASRDSTSANTASDTDARAASADNEHSAPTESSPNEDNADPTLENPSSSKPSEVAPGTEIPSENPPANTPTTESSTSEAQSDKTTGATGTFDSVGDENAKTGNGDSAQLSSSEKSVEMGAVANGVKADGKHPDEKDTVMNDASSARAFNAPSAAKLKAETKTDDAKATGSLQKDREQAMKTLQSLQHLDSPESVAPWWLSRVDDALLMLYVCRDGWMKGRTLPHRMVEASSLFGDRAKTYAASEWPTVAVLNRRIKVLLHVWAGPKRQRPVAPVQAISAPSMNVHAGLAERQKQEYFYQQQQQHQQLQRQFQQQQQERQRAEARQYSSSFHGSRHNQFAKLIFSYGIPDVSTCRDERERNEKWRYFLQDSQLGIGRYSLEELLAEALDLERVCRQRMHDGDGTRIIEPNEENSILGGKRGFWLLTTTQCKRLLHRVDLFRLLRTQILVLPPGQLVEVVSRVVRAQGASTDYPHWWSSPRHDILLLQGVECYGLDEHLAAVWKLPLFNSANTASHFPTTTWVENYVTALSIACRNLIVKAREYRTPEDAYAKSSDDEAAEAVAEEEAPPADTTYGDPKHSDPTQDVSETRRRIRDIRGMREEDPYFAPTVRLRQLIETNAARDQQAAAQSRHRESKESSPEKEIARTSKDESKSGNLKSDEMLPRPSHTEKKSHTQDVSERVLKVRLEETKRNESKAATKQVVSAASNGKKRLRSFDKASSSPRLIHIDDDEKEDKDSDDDSSVSSPPRSRSSSSSQSAHNVVQGPAAAAVAAAKAERQQSAVRPWDVIVIDDSEADSD